MNEISSDRKPNQRGKNLIFALNRYIAMKEGKKERKEKTGEITSFLSILSDFPANPSQILPTFCQDNEVKP